MTSALILGGGPPLLTLQAGALTALDERDVQFDVISTAGAGTVVGLLYAAPRAMSPREALQQTREMGVHDSIYERFPVNYKLFHKPGMLADSYRRWMQSLPRMVPDHSQGGRLFADWMALWCAALCPSDLSEESVGLSVQAPWLDEIIDVDKLQEFPGEFYVNAYCIEDQEMASFSKEELTLDHLYAALAFPFIYPPVRLGGKTYIEGSAIDTLCFQNLLRHFSALTSNIHRLRPLHSVTIFDALSPEKVVHEPSSLYDAWVQSMMVPLVRMAKNDIELLELSNRDARVNILKIGFDLPVEQSPRVFDWSYSNLSLLFEIGYGAGCAFYDDHKQEMPKRTRAFGMLA